MTEKSLLIKLPIVYDNCYMLSNKCRNIRLWDLLETNIRQREDVGGSAKKVGLRIKELERLYKIEHGGNHGNQYVKARPNNSDLAKSQEQLAAQMGMSVDTLKNYKLLADMIPELEDLLDTGIVW